MASEVYDYWSMGLWMASWIGEWQRHRVAHIGMKVLATDLLPHPYLPPSLATAIAMSNVERPLKRLRAQSIDSDDAVTSTSLAHIQHDTDFYWEGGNIVLIAQTTAFCILRCLLSLKAPVFASMFASSSPSTDEIYEGHPVVRLSESSDDVRDFLHALFPGFRPV